MFISLDFTFLVAKIKQKCLENVRIHIQSAGGKKKVALNLSSGDLYDGLALPLSSVFYLKQVIQTF